METYPAICFTGHRKIGADYEAPEERNLEMFLVQVVTRAVEKGFRNFISGGAIGTDQIAAKAVLRVRRIINHTFLPGPNDIHLLIARPFPSQAKRWPERIQTRFNAMCQLADKVYDVSKDPFSADKMDIRNRFMVDSSSAVIAVWNGQQSGGTWNCLQYARGKGRDILIINPITLASYWETAQSRGGNNAQANNVG